LFDHAAPGALTSRFSRHPHRWCTLGVYSSVRFVRLMSKPAKPPTFESALAELEDIVSEMEAGQLPLEKSLAAYKRGAELLKFCQGALQDAQQQVKILEDGVLKNFTPAAQ
jgi:exodeoxyribonuclease VII small subunit